MPVYVSKAGGVGLANVLTVEDLDSSWITGALSVDTSSFIKSASFGNPFVTFSFGDGSQQYVNLSTLQPNTASYALTASYLLSGIAAAGNEYEIQFNSGSSFGATGSFKFNYLSQSLEHGENVSAISPYSHAQGLDTQTGTNSAYSASVVNGLVTLWDFYGDISGDFGNGNVLFLYDLTGYTTYIIDASSYNFSNGSTEILLYDTSVNESVVYVGNLSIWPISWAGDQTIASAGHSHAQGQGTVALGGSSHAEGILSTTTNAGAHAEGIATIAAGYGSHAEGSSTISQGMFSHAEGGSTRAIGNQSHTEGEYTLTGTNSAYSASAAGGIITVNSYYFDVSSYFTNDSYALLYDGFIGGDNIYGKAVKQISQSYFDGTNTIVELYDGSITTNSVYVYIESGAGGKTIPANSSHAEGVSATALGNYSHVEGTLTVSMGESSHAEGANTKAIGDASHAEGLNTQAIGNHSHAEGQVTQASGDYSHAEGAFTLAVGDASHAEGQSTQALGDYSHAEGLGTITSGPYQHAQGQYNLSSSVGFAFIIGNGTADNARSNLVFASGSQFQITGSLTVTAGITGSLFGSSSYALTASFIDGGTF